MSAFGLCFNLGSVMPYIVITPRLARLARPTSRNHHYLRVVPSRTFGSNPNGDDEGSGAQMGPGPRLPSFSSRAPGFARRPLSPLERVSQMLPQESLSKEIWDLRGDGGETQNQTSVDDVEDLDPQKLNGDLVDTGSRYQNQTSTDDVKDQDPQNLVDTGSRYQNKPEEGMHSSHTLPTERTLCFGEILLAEYRRKRRLEFQKMFRLEEGAKLMSNWGVIRHEAVEGCHAGTVLRTSLGLPILIRRPSLEEFTLFMKRGPAIAYPKDASAMLMMMDVNEGDSVLESGSGSGAMSLFLSRAVGSKGSVLSAEVRQDHHRRAVLNYERWRSAWRLRTGGEWPDNVKFHHADLITSAPLLAGRGFNSIALDMVNPQLALPTVVPHLHTGGVCAVYQANITQIIDLMEGLRCSDLPLVCERIMEVQYRDWLLAPSLRKDGTFNQRKAPGDGNKESEDDDSRTEEAGKTDFIDKQGQIHVGLGGCGSQYVMRLPVGTQHCQEEAANPKTFPFGSVPYIARPHPEQTGHTAFLVKLRKISR